MGFVEVTIISVSHMGFLTRKKRKKQKNPLVLFEKQGVTGRPAVTLRWQHGRRGWCSRGRGAAPGWSPAVPPSQAFFPVLGPTWHKSYWRTSARCFTHLPAHGAAGARGAITCHIPGSPPGAERGSLATREGVSAALVPHGFPHSRQGQMGRSLSSQSPCPPSTEGRSRMALLWHRCLTQLVALAKRHLRPQAGARARHGSLLLAQQSPRAAETQVTLAIACRAAELDPTQRCWECIPQAARRLSVPRSSTAHRRVCLLPGKTLRINQHAHAVVVKHLFVQVI